MINFCKFNLDNGLKVLVHQDKSTPLVMMNILYNCRIKMNRPLVTLILFFMLAFSLPDYGQKDEEPPASPIFNLVSVNQLTGNVELSWSLSTSTDVAGYVVYLYQNGEGYAIDTIHDPTAASYIRYGSGSSYFSESFVVAAIDSSENISPLSNELHTIYTEAQIDTCNKKIITNWNKYASYPNKVTGYAVFISENGGNFTQAGLVTEDNNIFVLEDFIPNVDYCFLVKAYLDNSQVSVSNKFCLNARMQRPPQWINADYATIDHDKKIFLSFTFDPLSEITHFRLERKSGTSDVFQQIANFSSDNGSVKYTDDQADTNVNNYYRLSAINNCNLPVITSNIASNIVLSLQSSEDELKLIWTSYKKWQGIISSYKLFINTGKGFIEKAIIEPYDTVVTLNYIDIMYDITRGDVCFFITGIEMSNPYNINGESRSNEICHEIVEIITVPNLFTPDGDLKNDLFRPILSFTPSTYHLIITDRQGRILFETRDPLEAWDGYQDDKSFPQGVCVWFLRVRTPSGKEISRTGTLTVFRNIK